MKLLVSRNAGLALIALVRLACVPYVLELNDA